MENLTTEAVRIAYQKMADEIHSKYAEYFSQFQPPENTIEYYCRFIEEDGRLTYFPPLDQNIAKEAGELFLKHLGR